MYFVHSRHKQMDYWEIPVFNNQDIAFLIICINPFKKRLIRIHRKGIFFLFFTFASQKQ